MRKITVISIFLLVMSSNTSGAINDFIGMEYNFTINENVNFTHHENSDVLITVRSEEQTAYGVEHAGGDPTIGYWLRGINRISTLDKIIIGDLYQGGFTSNHEVNRVVKVVPFNQSIPQESLYDTQIKIKPASFVNASSHTIIGVDASSYPTVIIVPEIKIFVTDPQTWISSFEVDLLNYTNNIESEFDIETSVSTSGNSISYQIEGEMLDIPQFTYHEQLIAINDYNTIQVDGEFSIGYTDLGRMNSYSVEYNIMYEDVRIMNYELSVDINEGMGGNSRVGGSNDPIEGISTTWIIIITVLTTVIIEKIINEIYQSFKDEK